MIAFVYALFSATLVCTFLSDVTKRASINRLFYIAIGIAMIAYCAFREVGADQDSVAYSNYFNLSDYAMAQISEPSFVLIASISRSISSDNSLLLLFLIYAILGVTIKMYAISRLTSLVWLSLLTYIGSFFLLHEFTQIRAGVAAGLVLLSITHIVERRAIIFVSLVTLACMFHYSALVFFPMYFLGSRALSVREKFLVAAAIPAGIALHFADIDLMFVIPVEYIRNRVEIYTQVESLRGTSLNVFNAVYIIKYVMLYVFLLMADSMTKCSKYAPIMIKIYAISMFSYLALSYNAAFAMRISELIGIVEIVLIPFICYAIRPRALAVLIVIMMAAGNLALGIFQTKLIQPLP